MSQVSDTRASLSGGETIPVQRSLIKISTPMNCYVRNVEFCLCLIPKFFGEFMTSLTSHRDHVCERRTSEIPTCMLGPGEQTLVICPRLGAHGACTVFEPALVVVTLLAAYNLAFHRLIRAYKTKMTPHSISDRFGV